MSAPEDERVQAARVFADELRFIGTGALYETISREQIRDMLFALADRSCDERATSEPDLTPAVREAAKAYESAKVQAASVASGDWFDFKVHESRIRLAEAALAHVAERAKGGAE